MQSRKFDLVGAGVRAKLSLVLTSLFVVSGCSTMAVFDRKGYSLGPERQPQSLTEAGQCKVSVTFKESFKHQVIEKKGQIEAYDSGLSINCHEDFVIGQFVKDACAIGANVVNVTEESQPDFWSTCYRAKADLISAKDKVRTDPRFFPEKIIKRSKAGKEYTEAMLGVGIGGVLSPMLYITTE